MQADDSSTLRDLLSSEQRDEDGLQSWANTDTSLVRMKVEETRSVYSCPHDWECDGMVLKLLDPHHEENTTLFKVNQTQTLLTSPNTTLS